MIDNKKMLIRYGVYICSSTDDFYYTFKTKKKAFEFLEEIMKKLLEAKKKRCFIKVGDCGCELSKEIIGNININPDCVFSVYIKKIEEEQE